MGKRFHVASRILLLLLLAAAALGGWYALRTGALMLPERFDPWAPLVIRAEPNFLTPYKLMRARNDAALCLAALAQTGVPLERLANRTTGPGCGFENAVRLHSAGGGARLGGAAVALSCPMALSLAMWDTHTLQPTARARFGEPVVAIDHLGSYACRNVNRGEGAAPDAPPAQRSRHATADALDVAGFTLEGGRRISVRAYFGRAGTAAQSSDAAAGWLADVHAGACMFFPGVLGPDYNAVHHDHFHLETGGYRMCR